jgi:hypothetical protein
MDNYVRQSNIESISLYSLTARANTLGLSWYLLPLYSPLDVEYFRSCSYGFIHIYRKLTIDRGIINQYSDLSNNPTLLMDPQRANDLETLIYKNQSFRWKIKRLIHKWRLARFKQANMDDILTGEPPVKPVYIYDWLQRTRYVLEANTLYRDIYERLFTADGLFTNVQYPRNLYTNNHLTVGQIHFIIQDLKKYGFMHWALQGFESCNYAINLYKRIYKQAIHLEVLKRCFINHTNNDCIELVVDFIELEHEYHDRVCVLTEVLIWYIKTYPDCPLVEAWRKLCFKYYKHAYMNNDHAFKDVVHMMSESIIRQDHTFIYQKYVVAGLANIV